MVGYKELNGAGGRFAKWINLGQKREDEGYTLYDVDVYF